MEERGLIIVERLPLRPVEELVIGCVIALVGFVLLPFPVTWVFLAAAAFFWARALLNLIR